MLQELQFPLRIVSIAIFLPEKENVVWRLKYIARGRMYEYYTYFKALWNVLANYVINWPKDLN